MEITRSVSRHGNVKPPIFSLLAEIPSGSAPHLAHGLRPPGAIYKVSMDRVLAAFGSVLDEVAALDHVADEHAALDHQATRVLAAQVELLEAMMAHMDDGYQVLKACHPPHPEIDEPFADRWLEKAKHPTVRQYKQAIKPYRDSIAPIVNKIKHEHGQVRLVLFSGDGLRVGGYYIEGVQPDGVLGPDPRLHPGNTAISFNRDLRFHIVNVFDIGCALKGALAPALRALGVRPSGRPVPDTSNAFADIAERIALLGEVAFPDEVRRPTPYVGFRRAGDDVEVTARYPSMASLRPPGNMRVAVLIKGDGHSTQYRVPYWQPQPDATVTRGRPRF